MLVAAIPEHLAGARGHATLHELANQASARVQDRHANDCRLGNLEANQCTRVERIRNVRAQHIAEGHRVWRHVVRGIIDTRRRHGLCRRGETRRGAARVDRCDAVPAGGRGDIHVRRDVARYAGDEVCSRRHEVRIAPAPIDHDVVDVGNGRPGNLVALVGAPDAEVGRHGRCALASRRAAKGAPIVARAIHIGERNIGVTAVERR